MLAHILQYYAKDKAPPTSQFWRADAYLLIFHITLTVSIRPYMAHVTDGVMHFS